MLARKDLTVSERLKVASLSSLYSLYKNVKHAGDPLPREAEFTHGQGGDPNWNESWYFNFTDPSRGIGGYTRIGILPNQESDIGVLMLYAGGRRLLVTQQSGRVKATESGLEIGDLSYERVEPLSRWRLKFKGEMGDLADSRMLTKVEPDEVERTEVEVDLSFDGLAPCFNFKNADPRALAEMLVDARTRLRDAREVSKVSSEHYEQAGLVKGSMEAAGEEWGFEGSGHRDHSWGVRDWSAPRLWTWLTGQFGSELAFNLSRVVIGSVDIFNGFLCRDGRNYPVRRARLETEFEEDGLTQKTVRFTFEDTTGTVVEVNGDVRVVIPLDLRARGHSTLINEALTEYTWEGRKGLGIAEYLHQMPDRDI